MYQQKIVVVGYGAEVVSGGQTVTGFENLGELLHPQIVILAFKVNGDTLAQITQDIIDLKLEAHH